MQIRSRGPTQWPIPAIAGRNGPNAAELRAWPYFPKGPLRRPSLTCLLVNNERIEVDIGDVDELLVGVPLCEKCGTSCSDSCWKRSYTPPADRTSHWCKSCVLDGHSPEATLLHEHGLESPRRAASGRLDSGRNQGV